MNIGVRVAAGITTGALAVLVAQPTDVVKIRLQAGNNGRPSMRYSSTMQAYKDIARMEGARGLWRGEEEFFQPDKERRISRVRIILKNCTR